MRVDEFLADFLAAAVLVAVVLVTLHWMTDRMKMVYADFGLRLPRPTMLLLDVSDASRACYGWVMLVIVPFAAPFVLTRLPPRARRWVATLAILLVGLFVIFAMFAMFEPMITIMTRISGKR
jgi:type II secretory pathway component PulF